MAHKEITIQSKAQANYCADCKIVAYKDCCLFVNDEIWAMIFPAIIGVLCANCMIQRLIELKLNVEAIVYTRPGEITLPGLAI